MKQKRQLIESLKEKESSQQQLVEECQGKMVREEGEKGGEGRGEKMWRWRGLGENGEERGSIGSWGVGDVAVLHSVLVLYSVTAHSSCLSGGTAGRDTQSVLF